MSDSSTLLDLINESQAGKATAANDLLDAASPAMLYGRRASTTGGLTWGYFGGRLSSTLVANGTVALTASATNYIVAARSNGAVTVATTTTNWDNVAAYVRLYKVVTGTATVTSYEDHRESSTANMLQAEIAINAQTGTAYTLVLGDKGKMVTMSNSSANTLTVPPNSSVAFLIGTSIMVSQAGSGQTTIAAGAGVTINKPSTLKSRAQYSTLALLKTATDTWLLMGDTE